MTVAEPIGFRAAGQDGFVPSTTAPPVCATKGGGAGMPTLLVDGEVRRATPCECLALQGFDRRYLDEVAVDRARLSDTAKYKMAGNAWSVPAVAWAFARIDVQLTKQIGALDIAENGK